MDACELIAYGKGELHKKVCQKWNLNPRLQE